MFLYQSICISSSPGYAVGSDGLEFEPTLLVEPASLDVDVLSLDLELTTTVRLRPDRPSWTVGVMTALVCLWAPFGNLLWYVETVVMGTISLLVWPFDGSGEMPHACARWWCRMVAVTIGARIHDRRREERVRRLMSTTERPLAFATASWRSSADTNVVHELTWAAATWSRSRLRVRNFAVYSRENSFACVNTRSRSTETGINR